MVSDGRATSNGGPLDTAHVLQFSDFTTVHARHTPDKIALLFGDYRWTYAELDRACDCMVSLLREAGLKPGDRVAYKGKNNDLFFVMLIGSIRAEMVAVPVNWRNTAPETRHVLDDSNSRLVFVDRELLPSVEQAAGGSLPITIVDDDGPTGLRQRLRAVAPAARDELDPTTPSLQLYTSGTTGKPKGVLTSQSAYSVQRHIELASPAFADWRQDEILLSPLPSFHIGGMSWVGTGLVRGSTVVLTANTAPSHLVDLCLSHSITRIFIVPALVRALLDEAEARGVELTSLRGIHYGAAPMDPALLVRAVDRLGCRFLQYYGMTEITGSMTILAPQDHDANRPELLRSVGQPLPGHSIEIRGAGGELLKIDKPGEVWVRSPSLFMGYWNQPEATAEALVHGWYRTGDGGRLDEAGFLYLTDRIKDMIVSGGENVYPAEVEAVLREHPAVQDCAVFGLPHPKWGEGVVAAIELKAGETIDESIIIAFARECLAGYKVPRRVEFGVALPRTASGKVQRRKLRSMFLEGVQPQ